MSADTPANIEAVDENSGPLIVRNEDLFGHGFSICGCFLLHLLKQREKFELLDFSYQVLNTYNFECISMNSGSQQPTTQNKLVDDRNSFIMTATFQKLVHLEAFAIFDAVDPNPKTLASTIIFKPPAND